MKCGIAVERYLRLQIHTQIPVHAHKHIKTCDVQGRQIFSMPTVLGALDTHVKVPTQ